MPSKNVVRNFAPDNYYHVLNRGVEKRTLFLDKQDHLIFLYYLRVYLLPLEKLLLLYPKLPLRFYSKNLSEEVKIIAYCLMPNHFHLLLEQKTQNGISKLMKQITNAYTQYFNQKYKRVGGLMQGRFKAILVDNDEYLIQLSKYIHLNPIKANLTANLLDYQWSSFPEYAEKIKIPLSSTNLILNLFETSQKYQEFVLDQAEDPQKNAEISALLLEDSRGSTPT